MKTLHVWPESPQSSNGEIHLRAVVEGLDKGSQIIEFTVPDNSLAQLPSREDHFALATLFTAMRFFERCLIHGEMSHSLLVNLAELNALWQAWRPEIYHPVEWSAEAVVEEPAVSYGSHYLLSFSGGVDSCATLKRHTSTKLGLRRLPIGSAVIIHGFDIPLEDVAGFYKAKQRAERITESAGIPLLWVRTNVKGLPDSWEDSHGAKYAATFHIFNRTFRGAILASGGNWIYPPFPLPWGSNPISDHWLGTPSFPLRLDGIELSRLEKLALISDWKSAIENLRVCWEGKDHFDNCGVCEKCVRTQLGLAVLGIESAHTFQKPIKQGTICKLHLHNHIEFSELQDILLYCEQKRMSPWWLEELREFVRKGYQVPVVQ